MPVQVRRRTIAAVIGCLVILLAASASTTAAHPLGNFTVNRYSRIEVHAGGIRIRYVLDFAEIPSVQEWQSADTNHDGFITSDEWDAYRLGRVEGVRRNLELTVDGTAVDLQTDDSALSTPMGQADIPLVRIEAWFRTVGTWPAGGGEHQATFRDRNEPTRIGWREIVVRPDSGVILKQSTAPQLDATDELRSYPENMLLEPLNTRDANWAFALGGGNPTALRETSTATAGRPVDAFTSLITASDLNPGVILLALLVAASLGGIHAASPGHGKTVMAAYIVGTQGTLLHAVVLALTVTVSHTLGVLVLGLVTLLASNLILPEQLYPWLTLAAALIVLALSSTLVFNALRGQQHVHHEHHEHAEGAQTHEHLEGATHTHAHAAPRRLPITWRNLFALGLAGGIVPSASALVVLLSALALGRLGFGLVLILAFGVGMAVVLTTTGVLLVYAARFMARYFPEDAHSPLQRLFSRVVPLGSAALMLLIGVVATLQALSQFGLLPF
jgi:nickel/cobalt transporter (NicO) family protein